MNKFKKGQYVRVVKCVYPFKDTLKYIGHWGKIKFAPKDVRKSGIYSYYHLDTVDDYCFTEDELESMTLDEAMVESL